MSTPKLPAHSTFFITVLLSACAAYQTSGVSPARSRLASITTTSGAVVVFDTLPAPQVIGDTIHGSQGGVPCAIPTSDVAEARWVAASGEQPATRATADQDRGAGVELATVDQGAHVRITAPSLGWDRKTGDVAAVRGDTLLLRRTGGLLGLILSPRRVPMNAVTTLEVSRNHGDHVSAVYALGLLGMVGGGFAAYRLSGPCPPGLNGFGCELGRVFVAVPLGGAVGGVVGGLIGAAIVPERWEAIPLGGAHVGLIVQPGGRVGLGVSLAL